jgi:hypothetical protein
MSTSSRRSRPAARPRPARALHALRAALAVVGLLAAEVLVPLLAASPAAAATVDTTTTVTTSGTPSVYGQQVTFTATVSASQGGLGTPTGTVAFKDNGNVIPGCGAATVTAGSATCQTLTLTAGSHAITAVYTPDTNGALVFNPSTGTLPGGQTVNQATTTTAVNGSPNPSLSNESVTITAAITVTAPGGGTPTGTVNFKNGSTSISGCSAVAVDGTGKAVCTTSTLPRGNNSITAVYSGDANYVGSTSSSYTQTVGSVASTTDLTSDTNPSVFGQSITLTAQVSSTHAGTPTGTVAFDDGDTAIPGCASVALDGTAQATCTTSALGAGAHPLSAVYSGDNNFATSTGTLSQTVNKADTTSTATSTSPTVVGQPGSITVTVSPVAPGAGTPTGTVDFKDNGTAIPGCTGVALDASGKATCSTTGFAAGSHPITFAYNGDGNFNTSAGQLTYTVNTASTNTVLDTSAANAVFGQTVTFTATVSPVAPGAGTPDGTVDFKDGTTTVCSAVPLASGQATCALNNLAVGSHSMTAVYSGSAGYSTSTSNTVTETIAKDPTTTTVSSSAPTSEVGQTVTFTATVTPNAPGSGTPTGTVVFKDGTTTLCSNRSVDATGKATCQTSALAVGNHSITADYSGDASYAASTSSAFTQSITQHGTSTALAASPVSPSQFGDPVTFTATVTAATQGVTTPDGTVTFKDGGTAIAGCAAQTLDANGKATCTTSALAIGSHTISAVYNGNSATGNYGASTGTLPYDVNKDGTTTTVTDTPNPSVTGQSVALTATVASSHTGTPTGAVAFSSGGTTITGCGSVPVTSGQAVCHTTTLPVGSDSISAVYSGDSTFATSTGTATQTVNKADTAAALASSANPSVFGQPVTFTATVSVTAPGAGTPTGSVTFSDGTTTLCTTPLDNNGQATCQVSNLAVGGHSVTAAYAGDPSFNASTSSPLAQTVIKADTATALASSDPNGALVNQSVTFTATVSVTAPGAGTPTGTVKFQANGNDIAGCSAKAVAANGTATCTTSFPTRGDRSITAIYSGDPSFATSTSSPLTQPIGTAPTTTTLDSSANPATATVPVTLTATVGTTAPGTPGGTVAFKDGGTTIPGCGAKPVDANGQATCSAAFDPGTQSLTAVYGGSTNFQTSTGSLSLPVNAADTTTTVASGTNPSASGQPVTFTATVSPVAPATATPTGTVDFKDGATTLCSAVALSSGTATCTTSLASAGSHTITASYSGDQDFTVSSDTVAQTVNKAATTTALASSPNPSTAGQAVTFTATISVTAPGGGSPTGSVTFSDGATTLCSAVPVSAGTATCSKALAAGTHSVTAAYSGDATHSSSSSSAVSQVVNKATTTTAVAASPTTALSGQTVTFTATISVTAPGSGSPTGTVAFKDGTTTLCAASAVSSGQATCAVGLPTGGHSVTAVYSGDSSFTGSTSSPVTVTVNQASTTMSLTPAANPSTGGQAVTVTATVAPVAPAGGVPTGSVTFTVDSHLICISKLDALGHASCSPTFSTGSHPVAASYGGDTNDKASSASYTQTANPLAGYWLVSRDGTVYGFGGATPLGNAPTSSAVHIEATPNQQGYWVVDEAGNVFGYSAPYLGGLSAGQLQAGEIATSLSGTPSGQGYWIFTNRGRVFTFGDAQNFGDLSGTPLNGPIIDSVATPTGKGYYLVASDGGVFAEGDAKFRGSMGGKALNAPVVGIVPTADNTGYYLVASDGGVFAFPTDGTKFWGSMGGQPLNKPMSGIARYGSGYIMVAQDGGVFDFSDQPFNGSLGSNPPTSPVVSITGILR